MPAPRRSLTHRDGPPPARACLQVVIAERCYAALGDISKTRYLHRIVKQAQRAAQDFGGNGYESYTVRSQLAQLNRQWPAAESLLLAQGRVDECIAMYQNAYKCAPAAPAAAVCERSLPSARRHSAAVLCAAARGACRRWEDALRVADASRHPDTEALKGRYYK